MVALFGMAVRVIDGNGWQTARQYDHSLLSALIAVGIVQGLQNSVTEKYLCH